MGKVHYSSWIFLLISLCGYFLTGYEVERHDTLFLFSCFIGIFLMYLLVVKRVDSVNFNFWIIAGALFRLVFLFSVPVLSDDIYRFIWDGRMLYYGLNPFEFLPSEVLNQYPLLNAELFDLLNSQERPTIYPPFSQWVFLLSVYLSPDSVLGSIVVQRIILLLGEAGLVFLSIKLLKRYGLPKSRVLLYALNPLVILEISGNLHFEGLMLFFFCLAVLHLFSGRMIWGSLAWSFSVAVKLIPLMFLPVLFRRLGWKKWLVFSTSVVILTILFFIPVWSPAFYLGFKEALLLYFQKFEFNASIYYLVREVGFWQKGWNMIAIIGPRLAITTVLLILGFTWFEGKRQMNLFESLMWVLLIYFSLALIVHPWYIISLVLMSTFTRWKWPLVWSFLILLSYEGYTETGYVENYGFIATEYILLTAFIIYEAFQKGLFKTYSSD